VSADIHKVSRATLVRGKLSEAGNPSWVVRGIDENGSPWAARTIPNGSVGYGIPNLFGGYYRRVVIWCELDRRGRIIAAWNDRGQSA
jgi:hypothetical protein